MFFSVSILTLKLTVIHQISMKIGDVNKTSSISPDTIFYLEIYSMLALSNTLFIMMRAFFFAYGGICAAKTLHKKLLTAVLFVSFFDRYFMYTVFICYYQ